MSTSLPSRDVFIVDVPEPITFSIHFKYNFFVADEGKSETGGIPKSVLMRSSEELGADFIQNSAVRIPRYSVLEWSLPNTTGKAHPELAQREQNSPSTTGNLIARNIKKIVTEIDLSSLYFFSVLFSDSQIDERMFTNVLGSSLQHTFGTDVSHYRTSTSLASTLPSVNSRFLEQALCQPRQAYGATFFDQRGINVEDERWTGLKSVNSKVLVNSRIVNDVLTRVSSDPHSPYTDEVKELLKSTSKLSAYLKQRAVSGISESDFVSSIPFVDVRAGTENNTQHSTTAKLVGYVIDKIEHLPDGSTRQHDSIIIENPRVSTFADVRVKYGSSYSYTIRTIALFTMPAIDEDTDDVASISVLISSQPIQSFVKCVELDAPPPPADTNFTWNYETERLMVHWSFPPNPQRDIKEFQVFRRKTIREPFELIKSYRFNDAIVQTETTIHFLEDNINNILIENLSNPVTMFIDDDFTRASSFIYTVCCVDAHGMTSNYGVQYQIGFDVFKNKLTKSLISHSGAPKAYPNLYLNADLFVDTIRTSGPHSKRLKLTFNPEFYSVIDNHGREKSVVSTVQEGGSYVFQFINTDRQQSIQLKVNVDDRRTKKR